MHFVGRADVVLVKAPSRAPPCHARRGQRRGAARRRSPLTGTCAATVPRRGPSRRAEQSAGAASQGNPRPAGPRRLPVPLQPAPGDAPRRAVRWRTRGLYRRAGGVCGPRTGSVLRCRGGETRFGVKMSWAWRRAAACVVLPAPGRRGWQSAGTQTSFLCPILAASVRVGAVTLGVVTRALSAPCFLSERVCVASQTTSD